MTHRSLITLIVTGGNATKVTQQLMGAARGDEQLRALRCLVPYLSVFPLLAVRKKANYGIVSGTLHKLESNHKMSLAIKKKNK